jgi:competence protein ComGF
MSEEALKVFLDSTFDRDQVLQIRAHFVENHDVVVRSEVRTFGLLPEMLSVTPIIGALVGLINLTLTIAARVQAHHKDNVIELDNFKKMMDTELAKLGLLDCKIVSIENFSVISEDTGGFSRLVVSTSCKEVALRVERRGRQLQVSIT